MVHYTLFAVAKLVFFLIGLRKKWKKKMETEKNS